ncbi:MAG: alpha-amylase family glycosyl hydrolase, partial [Myxococcota bacterium]|nr:alpha-amylase family glycosyl hydrolase [Myxococcota bacterium]
PALGARETADGGVEVRVASSRATRVEVALFDVPFGATERLRVPLARDGDRWTVRVTAGELEAAGLVAPRYYGLRVFGPNWPYDAAWEPGSDAGRIADVDDDGNRMNPNKLLLDPYALELSHDPITDAHRDYGVFRTDAANRARDSGPFAPKGVVFDCEPAASVGPARAFRDEIVYEVHVRGLTMQDETVPAAERGTYAGAARRAPYLRQLGVTAIELLPLHETPNDQNDLAPGSPDGDNYWGYSSLSFFAPDRRYAADRSAGGPTRELRAMVDAFHREGIKVYVDVVYNHTAEGGASGDAATLLSWRGLDNAGFYELGRDPRTYVSSNGVGPNFNTQSALGADLVLASLRYWHEQLGVDGFRFDLAPVVANGCARNCYTFERDGILVRIAEELPARAGDGGAGVDLIAEPWGAVGEAYQLGNFPAGWSEWNDRFRDAVRRDLNRLDREVTTPRELLRRFSGSPDLFADDGRPPAASVAFVVAHDGLTLHDLFRYDRKNNAQAWPYGPSDGGTDGDLAWSHTGDPTRQATVTRTALALLALSAGVPMITGGDELGRTLRANNNPYNLDSVANWIDWSSGDAALTEYTSRLFAFRAAHRALRPAFHWAVFGDRDGDGLTEVRWMRDDGRFVDDGYLDSPSMHFLAWQLDGDELGDDAASIFVAYNGWSGAITATLPDAPPGTDWHLAIDTSPAGASFEHVTTEGPIAAASRSVASCSVVVLVAR